MLKMITRIKKFAQILLAGTISCIWLNSCEKAMNDDDIHKNHSGPVAENNYLLVEYPNGGEVFHRDSTIVIR